MADTIIDNINSIIRTKSELKSVLTENGQNPSDTFSEYPDMFRSAIAGAGADEETINSYISAYLSTYNYIDSDTLSGYNFIDQTTLSANSYITLQDIPSVDLSSYVTYSYLESKQYITQNDISGLVDNMYIEEDVGESDTITVSLKDVLEESGIISQTADGYDVKDIAIVAEEVVDGILGAASYISSGDVSQMGYITESDVAQMSYITMADVSACGYITASDIPSVVVPVVDENLIPKDNNTYTLGNASYYYAYTYTSNLNLGTHTIKNNSTQSFIININGNDRYAFGNTGFFPMATNRTLGQNTNSGKWQSTYTENLYAPNINLSSDGKHSIKISGNDIRLAYNDIGFYLNNNGFRPGVNGTKNLGTSSAAWGTTYTTNLYLNGTNLEDRFTYLIWTGTSAEYAALDNYTTYQIYLIQEA